jgi:[histone H3]-lysine4 N-trimethyltransferase ATXR3
MKQTIMAFIQLAKRLEDPKPINGRDENVSSLVKDNSSESKPKKKQVKGTTEKKATSKVDREIKRSLSKLKKRAIDSDSETSDDFSEDGAETDSSSSDTESDSTVLSDARGPYDSGSKTYDSVDYMADEREWGARMTKASLVPPVTRKYEVIDKYLIVTDEEEVKRKMTVALPEDYSEKTQLQKNGTDDLEMLELPEVKDYKPRKTLGDEVIEQEVYGIDPYTHNLLLDSMPEELNWPLTDKQFFIEEVNYYSFRISRSLCAIHILWLYIYCLSLSDDAEDIKQSSEKFYWEWEYTNGVPITTCFRRDANGCRSKG